MLSCSVSVLMINIIFMDYCHGLTLLFYICDVLFICCVFASVWDARRWFSFTHFGEIGKIMILLHQCVCRVCLYICLYARVVLWCKTLQVQVLGRYGVLTPPGFTGLSVPYLSNGSGEDSGWTLAWSAVTLMWMLLVGRLSCLTGMRVIVLWYCHFVSRRLIIPCFACFHLFE